MFKNKGRKGTYSEWVGAAWLLRNGFQVFKNICQDGIIDLIAIKGATLLKIDVKTATGANILITAEQELAGVVLLHVFDDGTCTIDMNPRVRTRFNDPINCQLCGSIFKARNWRQRHCSKKCKTLAYRAAHPKPSKAR